MKAMFATTTLTHKEPLKEQSQHKGNQNQKSNSVQITQHPDSAVPEASAPLHFSIMGANTFCFSIKPVWAGFIWHATEIGWTNTETSKKKQLITWGSIYTHTHTHTSPLFNTFNFSHFLEPENSESSVTLLSLSPSSPKHVYSISKFHQPYLLNVSWTHLLFSNLMATASSRSFSEQNYSNILQTNLHVIWLHTTPVQASPHASCWARFLYRECH